MQNGDCGVDVYPGNLKSLTSSIYTVEVCKITLGKF